MKKQIIYEGKYRRFIIQRGWEYVERTVCDGIVVILAVTKDKKIILVEQERVPVGGSVIELPAGLVADDEDKKGESLEVAARRELLEETGYEAKKMKFIAKGPANSATASDILNFFYAIDIKKTGKGGGDHLEDITVHEVPLKKVAAWLIKKMKSGTHVDPKVYAALYWYEKFLS